MKIPDRHRLSWLIAFLAGGLLAVSPVHAADDTMSQPARSAKSGQLHYLKSGEPDAREILPPPPLPGSPEQAADLAEVQAVYHSTSSNDMAAAYSEKKFSIFNFTPVIGDFFQSNNLPKTTTFFENVQLDAEIVTDLGKNYFHRPRPFTVDTNLANGKLEKSFAYPSGHSTESMTIAIVLADLFPDQHEAILAKARDIGWHRVEIARHYMTDIYAGRALAQAVVRALKASPDFQRDFAGVQAEIAAVKTQKP